MRNYIIITILLSFINSINVSSQNTLNDTCNRDVWVKRLAKKLPKEVCIPNGYHITEIYKQVDVNKDSLNDFIFDWNKKNLDDSDTIFVSIFTKKTDTSYTFLKTFGNLYPIYFKSYDFSYHIADSTLNELKGRYNSVNPFMSLKLKPTR